MTRDEAIKLLGNSFVPFQGRGDVSQALVKHPAKWVDSFVALGMLKLDEPKPTAREKFLKALDGRVIGHSGGNYVQQYVIGPSDVSILLQYVEAAGLRLVEK